MNLNLNFHVAKNYRSNSQIARILTENWVKENSYCPNCGNPNLSEFENNKPVADFFCSNCSEEFELKSKNSKKISAKITDGAYTTMISRIHSSNNPSFFFLNYTKDGWSVKNFLIIPKHYFIDDIIEKRNPLRETARRSGWVGCNIELFKIPESGRIFIVKDSEVVNKINVIRKWQSTDFLRLKSIDSRGWILDILNCIEKIDGKIFTLDQVYSFEEKLKSKYPNNIHIKEKIRQQLQVLRDKGVIEFIERGKYKKSDYGNVSN